MNRLLPLCCILLLSLPLQSVAERRAGGGNQALKRMQYLMQRLQAEKQALEEENGRLGARIAELERELERAGRTLERKRAAIERFRRSNEALGERIRRLQERNAKTVSKLKKLIGKYRDLALLVRELKAGGERDAATITAREQTIAELERKNLALYRLNRELMRAYRDKSIADTLAQREPLTGLGRVEMENLLQEYRFRNEDNLAGEGEGSPGDEGIDNSARP